MNFAYFRYPSSSDRQEGSVARTKKKTGKKPIPNHSVIDTTAEEAEDERPAERAIKQRKLEQPESDTESELSEDERY